MGAWEYRLVRGKTGTPAAGRAPGQANENLLLLRAEMKHNRRTAGNRRLAAPGWLEAAIPGGIFSSQQQQGVYALFSYRLRMSYASRSIHIDANGDCQWL